jgi:hypothetical protein
VDLTGILLRGRRHAGVPVARNHSRITSDRRVVPPKMRTTTTGLVSSAWATVPVNSKATTLSRPCKNKNIDTMKLQRMWLQWRHRCTRRANEISPNRYTFRMSVEKILVSIEAEIAQLKLARALLSSDGTQKTAAHVVPKKRKMSAAARKRIGDAQRKRWAKQNAGK